MKLLFQPQTTYISYDSCFLVCPNKHAVDDRNGMDFFNSVKMFGTVWYQKLPKLVRLASGGLLKMTLLIFSLNLMLFVILHKCSWKHFHHVITVFRLYFVFMRKWSSSFERVQLPKNMLWLIFKNELCFLLSYFDFASLANKWWLK